MIATIEMQKMLPLSIPRYFEVILPFTSLGRDSFADREVIVVDSECEDQKMVVLGYYDNRTAGIHEVVFPDPITTDEFLHTEIYHRLFDLQSRKIAVYNSDFESQILGIPKDRCIELMPYPYCPKEKFIILESLDKVSGRKNGKWGPTTYTDIIIHNYSCMVKEILLCLGHQNFARYDIRNQLKEMLDHV